MKRFIIVLILLLLIAPIVWVSPVEGLSGLRIAIYGGLGARADSILAMSRMFAAMGHQPQTIYYSDLTQGRVTTSNFDILVIPDGEEGKITEYNNNIQDKGGDPYIKSFVQSGGGLLAVGAGAMYVSTATGAMNWYPGTASQDRLNSTFKSIGNGYAQIKIVDSPFGANDLYSIYVPYYVPTISVVTGATKVAEFTMGVDAGKAAVIRWNYGSGRVVLFIPEPSVDGQGDLDWTAWDQLESQGYNPQMAWPLVAKVIEWLYTGSVQNNTTINPGSVSGNRFAVYATHTVDGGAYPATLPAGGRLIEYSNNTPLAIRDVEVKNGQLTGSNFDMVVFPGGYAYGYKTQLSGHEQKIRDFVSGGAGYLGLCAGAYYAADSIKWQGKTYDYPLDLFSGQVIGPLDDIIVYPNYTLTPVEIVDTTFGSGTLQQMYYGGGYNTLPAGVTNVAKYTYGGQYNNQSAAIRFPYGSGKVFLSGPHPEYEEGLINDWMYWDGYMKDSNTAINDPESDRPYMSNVLNWLKKTGATAPNFEGNMIAIAKGSLDDTDDSLGDSQRNDTSGGVPATDGPNNGWYGVNKQKTMDLTGFGINKSGTINSVTLKVQYSVEGGYRGTNYIQYSTDGTTWYDTTIKPQDGQVDYTATFDLKAAGVDTWAEIQGLRIKFYNNHTLLDQVGFDYVWVAVQ